MLHLERCIRTIQKKFLQKRTRRRLQLLPIYQCYLIHRYVHRYIKRFAARRTKEAVNVLLRAVISNKNSNQISFNCKLYELTARKLQKFRKWLTLVNRNKLRSLVYRWNLQLINGQVLHFKLLPQELQEFRSKEYEDMRTH